MTKTQFKTELTKINFKNIKISIGEFENEISFIDVYGDKKEITMFKLWESYEDKLKQIKSEI